MPIDIDQFVGPRVRALRSARDLTQQELAYRAGLAVQTISRVENARIGLSVANLADLCRALGVTLAEFFADAEPDDAAPDARRVAALMHRMTPAGRAAVLKAAEAIAEVTAPSD